MHVKTSRTSAAGNAMSTSKECVGAGSSSDAPTEPPTFNTEGTPKAAASTTVIPVDTAQASSAVPAERPTATNTQQLAKMGLTFP